MKITCEKCGNVIAVQGLGRKRLGMPVKIVLDTLQAHSTVRRVAEILGCSRPYIYKVLKDHGLTRAEIMTKGEKGK